MISQATLSLHHILSCSNIFETPKKVLKRARDAIEECKSTFKVKEGDQVERMRARILIELPMQCQRGLQELEKDGHVHAEDDDGDLLLLDRKRFQKDLSYMLWKPRLRPAS